MRGNGNGEPSTRPQPPPTAKTLHRPPGTLEVQQPPRDLNNFGQTLKKNMMPDGKEGTTLLEAMYTRNRLWTKQSVSVELLLSISGCP